VPEKKSVLVISRSASDQAYLAIILERIEYAPLLAKTAGEGTDLAREHSPALIIFNSFQPKSDMHSVISALRDDATVQLLPLVVMTMDDTPEEKEALIALGCSAVLSKPVDLAQAYEVFGRLTGQQRKTVRIPLRLQVEVEHGTQKRFLTCGSLSEGGMYLHTPEPFPENTALRLKFTLPLGNEEVTAVTEVIRKFPIGTTLDPESGVALRFVEISDSARRQIRRFIQHKMIGDLKWEPSLENIESADVA